MTDTCRTFMDMYRAGHLTADQIDDWVDMWHDAPNGTTAARLQLHEWLGLAPAEYARWVERNELPPINARPTEGDT